MRQQVSFQSGLTRDLETGEYEDYIEILRNEIARFLLNPSQRIYDHFKDLFVPKVKLPSDFLVDSGLLTYITRLITGNTDYAERSQPYLMLAKMIFLSDDLTAGISTDVLIRIVTDLSHCSSSSSQQQLMIVLNNILSEKPDVAENLVQTFLPLLLDYKATGISEPYLMLISRFEKAFGDNKELFHGYVNNLLDIFLLIDSLNEREVIIVLYSLSSCIQNEPCLISLLSPCSVDRIIDGLHSQNLSILEPCLSITIAALQADMVPVNDNLLKLFLEIAELEIDEGDMETVKCLAIRAIRILFLFTKSVDSFALFRIFDMSNDSGFAVKSEIMLMLEETFSFYISTIDCHDIHTFLSFIISNSQFDFSLASAAVAYISRLKQFVEASGRFSYSELAVALNIEHFLCECQEAFDDLEVPEDLLTVCS